MLREVTRFSKEINRLDWPCILSGGDSLLIKETSEEANNVFLYSKTSISNQTM
jgi:hypothetical protein